MDIFNLFGDQLKNQFVGGGLVLMATGSVVALCRRLPSSAWGFVARRISSVVEIRNSDPLFDYVTYWLDSQKRFSSARWLRATTEIRTIGDSGGPIGGKIDSRNTPRVFFSPSQGTHWFVRAGRMLKLERVSDQVAPSSGSMHTSVAPERERYMFTGYGKAQDQLKNLIHEIVSFGARPEEGIRIFYSSFGYWQSFGRKKPRSLASVILPEGDAESIIADVRKFLAEENWYREAGIPWHRGYLLWGLPGTGKTSLIAALAGELGMDLYLLNIAGTGMSDESLSRLMADIRPGSIVLMEDIDCTAPDRDTAISSNRVSLAGLLNCLDGVMSREGCMIFMTTNFREKLDSVLIRPGRIDFELEFRYATEDQMRVMASRFGVTYRPLGAVTMAEAQREYLRTEERHRVSIPA